MAEHSCVSCGGIGRWHATRQELACQSCGTAIVSSAALTGAVDHFPLLPRLADRPDSGRDWQPRSTHLRCRACQSIVRYDEHVVGGNCEACGTPALVASDRTGAPISPSGVLPLKLSEAEAREHFATWLRGRRVRGRASVDTIRPSYLPCWVFNARVSCRYRGEIQKKNRDGEYERRDIDGIVELTFDDYLVPAAKSVEAGVLNAAGPFPTAEMTPFDPRYLAGATVEVFTTNMWDAWDAASGRMERELQAALRDDSKVSPSTLETWPEWRDQRCAHVLVPAYLLTYRHGKKTWQAVVNGWTGTVAGDAPINVLDAIVLATIVLAIVGGALYGIYRLLF